MKTFMKNILPFNNREEMPVWQFVVKKFLAFWLCYMLGQVVAEVLVILLHFACGKNMLVGDVFDGQTITLIIYYGYIVIIGVTLLYWKWIEKKPLSEIGLTGNVGSYLTGGILAVILLALSVGLITLSGAFAFQGIFENIDIVMILLLTGGFIMQGAMEEILCRGLVLHALKKKTNNFIAIAVSTLVFILPHWSSLFEDGMLYGVIGIVNLVLISLIFSLLTLHYHSIWAACGLHSIWNAVLYAVLGLNLSGNDGAVTAIFSIQTVGKNLWNGGTYGVEASLITTVVLGLAVVLMIVMGRKAAKVR